MPLFAGTQLVDPGTDEVPVWFDDVGTMAATWTDPQGTEWFLTDDSDERGWFTTDDIAGWGAAPYEIVTDPHSRGGEVPRFVRQQPARITWPLYVWGETHMQFVQRYRALKRAFLMTVHRGQPGVLRVYRPDGTSREIDAFYEEGFKGESGEDWLWAKPVLTLFCPDGAWRGTQQVTEERVVLAAADFGNPFLTLSSSQVIGAATITNPGEIVSWPTWTITGPCTAVTATNNTLGQTWTLTYTLTAGQNAIVETGGLRPGARGPADQVISSSLNWPVAYLWGLQDGDNDVSFSVAGASTATRIRMDFSPRYEGA